VVNLSDYVLSQSELEVLSKGLNFVPCSNSTAFSKHLLLDIKTFLRRILLHKYFEGEENDHIEPFVYKNDEWTPKKRILDPQLLEAFNECMDVIAHEPPFPVSHNITLQERTAINVLRNNKALVINVADKGNNVVIQNKCDYISEILNQLNSNDHYERLEEPLYPSTAIKLTKILTKLKTLEFITSKQFLYLSPPPNPRPRHLYTLPKIHKPPEQWFIPFKIPTGRPITSDIDSESYHIAEYIHHFLQPLAAKQQSFIKDSFHFLDLIRECGQIPSRAFLVSLDVDSMYTNIDNHDGLKCLRRIFDQNPVPSRPDSLLLDLIRVCLFNNDFLFNGSFWLQKTGTAMGKIFAPSYANLFMAVTEQDFLLTTPIQPLLYKRYLDDIFMIWDQSLSSLTHFISAYNHFHPSIHFKHVIDPVSLDFLDLTIFKHTPLAPSTLLHTKVHFKVTNTLQLLHKSSFHPKHTFAGIIRGQLLRYYRLCSNPQDFHSATSTLFKALRKQRYSVRFLATVKYKLLKDIAQGVCLSRVPRHISTHTLIPLVYTHHLGSRQIVSDFIKLLRHIESHDLDNTRIVSACRRNKNLADLVVRNKL